MIYKEILNTVLPQYGIPVDNTTITPFGSGLINHTWKVDSLHNSFILQRINKNVFKFTDRIDHNLSILNNHFRQTAPDYLFAGPSLTLDGKPSLAYGEDLYRLQPFVKNSHTIDYISHADQAYEAAKQFGKFTRLLNTLPANELQYSLPDFHNLSLRMEQFESAVENAQEERIILANAEIHEINCNQDIAFRYASLVKDQLIPLRIIHHDTKISNVLLDDNDHGLCVIDLDTVMPGYFISDVGDMMRTYLAEATEEEQDFSKIAVRREIFDAIYKGYFEEMGGELTAVEEELFSYSGRFMIYMQAVRFLTDFLNGDTYYPIKYPLHNLKRAGNQLTLLKRYMELEERGF